MKALIRTWRFGQDAVVQLHGDRVAYDSGAHILYMHHPLIPDFGAPGVLTGYTITAGDEWTVLPCDAECVHHSTEFGSLDLAVKIL